MKNIEFNAWGECMSNDCRHQFNCAQHLSSGPFKAKTGKVPNVYERYDKTYWCDSAYTGEFSDEIVGFTDIREILKK